MDAKSLKVVQENRDYTMFSWSVQGASNPIHMKRGQGVWFWDGDDQRWLDFSSQLINLNVGHQHPKMLEAIKKQLNEGGSDVVSTYRERVAKAEMPEGVLTEVTRELDRLERTSEQNPEYGWIRTYLDWMLDIPWNVRSEDNYDLVEARRILDEDHTGLSDVKDRIIEFLAVRKLRKERGLEVLGGRGSGAIITLVGPPGVGKTSLGESVARALGRKFTRVSLGGIRDEADIRGHRRTYVGGNSLRGNIRPRFESGLDGRLQFVVRHDVLFY